MRDLALNGVGLAGEDGHGIADATFHLEVEAVEVHSLHVRLVSQGEHVPEHRLPLAEVQPVNVAVHQPVDTCPRRVKWPSIGIYTGTSLIFYFHIKYLCICVYLMYPGEPG